MALDKSQSHRPGLFKQSNKAHKHGQHRSKGSLNIAAKGKVSLKSAPKKRKQNLNRAQRRHQALQIRQNKRDEVLSKRRQLGGLESSPYLVCVVSLSEGFDPAATIFKLIECDSEAIVNTSPSGVIHITIPKLKQRFAIVIPSTNHIFAVLDTLKIANAALFVISAEEGVNFTHENFAYQLLTASINQSLPTPIIALAALDNIPIKKRNNQKQIIQKEVNKWFPDEKLIPLEKQGDTLNLLRKIASQKSKPITYRDRRPHLYAESVEYVKESQDLMGTLKISGYLRGMPLSVNDLIYIPGLGTYQMAQINAPPDPYIFDKEKHTNTDPSMECTNVTRVAKILDVADPNKQESLQSENIPDPMDAEQTWPTEEELEASQQQKVKRVKKVPKGWSNYQAAWIPDDDGEFISDGSNLDSEEEYMDAISEERSEYSDAEDNADTMTESEIGTNQHQYDDELDITAEQAELEKMKAAKSDLMFPDEIDTPQDTPARIRFQKYRGLESFRTTPWEPMENLPADYARIFKFQNFARTRKRVITELKDREGALSGLYVTLHLKDVPATLWKAFVSTDNPLILFGLLQHENKMSIVNVVLHRNNLLDEPLKSKEKLIIQCGYRRYIVNPIFSQHTNGNKHKFERFFQPASTIVATFYAPIQFSPSPILCFKEVNSSLVLVAAGSLLSCNPDRIVVKRIVLSGHLFKVYKKSAVVRFMFFNREDILYYKPCKLRTKYGRTGHIKEPLGTHGHMKCVFDGQMKSQDTVLLNLYKRIFPKWTYEECTVESANSELENMDM